VDLIDFIHVPKNGGTTIKTLVNTQGPEFFIRYHGHETGPVGLGGDQLIILRDPIDRFCSAVRYALNTWQVDAGVDNPSDFALAMQDANHQHHNKVMSEVRNTEHRVGDELLEWKWTYSRQQLWYHEGQRVMLFEHLEEDMGLLFRSHGLQRPELPHENATNPEPCQPNDQELSDDARQCLEEIYRLDIQLYEEYRNMDPNARLRIP